MNISDLNNLDFNNVGSWPLPVRILAITLICSAVLFAGYWFDTQEQVALLERSQSEEKKLMEEFETKQATAANLEAYRQQMKEMERTFGALLLKLPSKTEIADLLVDVSRVGLDSGLEFELFKPGAEIPKEFYAEFPISLRIKGSYHQLGTFASGVAALPRIVTIHNFTISSNAKDAKNSTLIMEATANTYRYLDKEEIKSRKDAKKKKRKKRRR